MLTSNRGPAYLKTPSELTTRNGKTLFLFASPSGYWACPWSPCSTSLHHTCTFKVCSSVRRITELVLRSVASFVTHLMATIAAAIQLLNTRQFHSDFTRLTTNGACGVNLLPGYWSERAQAEIPILVLNVVGLLTSAYLSWRLMKVRRRRICAIRID